MKEPQSVVSKIAAETGLSTGTLYKRLDRGWTVEMLNKPLKQTTLVEGKTIPQWAKELGISYSACLSRYKKHGSVHVTGKAGRKASVMFQGKSLVQWSQELGIPKQVLEYRMKCGYAPHVVLYKGTIKDAEDRALQSVLSLQSAAAKSTQGS